MDVEHPIWKTIHWVAVLGVIGAVLWLNASNFDHTEINSLIQIALAMAGLTGAKALIGRNNKKK